MDQPADKLLLFGTAGDEGRIAPVADKVVLIMRSRLFREGLARLLGEAKFDVVAEVSKAEELPGLEGFSGTPTVVLVEAPFCFDDTFLIALRRTLPSSRIVLLASPKELLNLKKTQLIDNIVSSETTGRFLTQVLRTMPPGQCVVTLNLLQSLIETRIATHPGPFVGEEQAPSRRETEILCCLIDGYSNKVIARQLGITEATVKVHLKGLLRKISAANRTQAAIWALNNGIRGTREAPPETGGALPCRDAQPAPAAAGGPSTASTG